MKNISVSLIGGQKKNEDKTGKSRINDKCCFVVADGDGDGSGDLAADAVVSSILECFGKRPEVSREALSSYFDDTHDVLRELAAAEKRYRDMVVSAAVLITDGKKAVWGHIGNCRLYRFENGAIEEITNDHTRAFVEFYSGKITFDEIRKSDGRRTLLRSFADFNSYRPEFSDTADVTQKTVFLLCSDGFWEHIGEEDIQWALNRSKDLRGWLDDMLVHIDSVSDKKCDNISAVAVSI